MSETIPLTDYATTLVQNLDTRPVVALPEKGKVPVAKQVNPTLTADKLQPLRKERKETHAFDHWNDSYLGVSAAL